MDPLAVFSEATRDWFERTFDGPTPPQVEGWPAIASGAHVLIQAPTGSGKTLTAFLYALDRLSSTPGEGLRVLYVSPLKALNYDIERNLRGPLAGLAVEGARRGAHRRHAAEGTARDPQGAARHPDHDARVALPDAHLAGARHAALGRDADPRRGARSCRHEARRAHGDQRRAPAGAGGAADAADRALGDAAPARGDRPVRRGRARDHARRCRHAQGARPGGRDAGRGHARARHRPSRTRTRPRPTAARCSRRPRAAPTRSGRRSTRRSCGSSRSIARRSSSSTTAGSPSGSRCG